MPHQASGQPGRLPNPTSAERRKSGSSREARPADQVRLSRRVAEVVVEAAGPGIGPSRIASMPRQPVLFAIELAHCGELALEPDPVVQRHVDRVEGCAPRRRRSPCSGRRSVACGCSGTAPRPARRPAPADRRRPAASTPGPGSPRPASIAASEPDPRGPGAARPSPAASRPVSCDQPVADVGVVVGAVERLLEPPVEQVARAGGTLHLLELLQRRLDAGVGQQRPLPVPLQGQQPLGEAVGVAVADEVAAVLPQQRRRPSASGSQPSPLQTILFTSSLQPSE